MLKINKKMAIRGIILLILLVSLSIFSYFYYKRNQTSALYLAISEFDYTKEELILPDGIVYRDDSGENIFVEGFNLFLAKEYDKARQYFLSALDNRYYDPALPAYSYYFIVQCDIMQDKIPREEIINSALNEIARYAPLSNDTTILWNLFNSNSSLYHTDFPTILLMEDFLNKVTNIELDTWAWIKNTIAMLEYDNEQYAKSIRHFYDVESSLADAVQTPAITYELNCAREYIANIHFAFKDYENAAKLYEQLVFSDSATESFDVFLGCINLANCYLEINDTVKAQETVNYLQSKLSQISEYSRAEAQASLYDILANIALKEHRYTQADSYLRMAEKYYDNFDSTAIIGGEYFIRLSRCKYWVDLKQYDKALPVLLDMLTYNQSVYLAFHEDIYSLLKVIYHNTKEYQKLHQVYEKLLMKDESFKKTIQREYLEFSSYYKENNQLKAYNNILSKRSSISFIMVIVILVILLVVTILLKIIARKNITDSLTGAYNRKKLNQIIKQYTRLGTPSDFAVIMIDIDFFKKYNDTYGHPEGDKALKKVSKTISSCVRSKDILIRYGGEEFLLLTTGISSEITESVCDRISQQINSAAISHKASEIADHITISMGACHQKQAKTLGFEAMVEEADQCLYRAKEEGRNRFIIKSI